jgi:hypothetical protein
MSRMETEGIRPLLYSLGVGLLILGATPVINALSGDPSIKTLLPGLTVCILGLAVIAWSYYWRPNPASEFVQKLSRVASNPTVYLCMALLVWMYTETLALQRNNEIIALRNDQHSIAEVLKRFVLPRRLTPEQNQILASFLLKFPAQDYSFDVAEGDGEASTYRADLQAALEKGGWKLRCASPKRCALVTRIASYLT